MGSGPFGPVGVGYIDKWADAKDEYGRDGMVDHDKEYEGPGLQAVAKSYL